ncbi:MAG: trypsin-like peptidase domain-containing protein [Rhodocyclales bacterium]|nr:trypsin-like peptidase domain-containing protein [Rhodocyclales bacterium]
MADKQSLYELLGLTDKASPEDIQNAHAAMRQALDAQPESEEKHNRIAILNDTRDLLLNRRQRAGYDRRQRDRRGDAPPVVGPAPARGWLKPVLASLLIGGLAYAAGRYMAPASAPTPPPAALAKAPAPIAANLPAASDSADDGPQDKLAAEIAAVLPPAAPPTPTPAAAPAPAAVVPQAPPAAQPQRSLAELLQAAAINTIAESTYAVVGGGGLGTGIAIDRDKLLTNCHVIAPNIHKGPLLAIHAPTGRQTVITHAAFLVREDACVAHAPGLNAKPIAWGTSSRLAPRATIYSLGFAQGRPTFSAGTLLGVLNRSGQDYLISTNHCDFGVSGGPLVDGEGRLIGLTSGGTRDKKYCASLTAETARRVLDQTLIAIDGFPTDYLTNLRRRW